MKLFVALGIIIALAAPALAAPPCNRCRDLPKLEKELFEQEWLQHEFHQYALGDKTPPAGDPGDTAGAMRDQVLADFNAWMKSSAGGGKGGNGGPALATDWSDCKLVKTKKVPFDEKKFREQNCKEVADFLIAHENKHVEQCKKYKGSSRFDLSYYMDYAAMDTEAYGTGIRNLRTSIANLAKKCGWEGSNHDTKKSPEDHQDEDVVPTKKQADELAKRVRR
jgi:hypothetical protein